MTQLPWLLLPLQRGLEYSDAYDMANQPESESGLLINPAVKAAVESQFAVAPDIAQRKGMQVKMRVKMRV